MAECNLCGKDIPDEEIGDVRWWLSPLTLRLIGACTACWKWVASLKPADRDKLVEERLKQRECN